MPPPKRFCLICGFLLLLLVCGPPAAHAGVVLRMNHQFPQKAAGSYNDQWFADQVKKLSKGELTIKIFWSNGLGEPSENLNLLKNGHIDMAAMSAGYFPNELPLFSAPNSIPMGMDNVCQADAIMNAFVKKIPAFGQEARQNGIRPLLFRLLNPYLLVSKKPVTTFAGLKGLRIRTWGKDMPRLMEAAGAKPVNLYLPDIHDAMKHGVIDACPFSVDLVVAYKIHELAKHISQVVLWEGPSWALWISEKAWARLSPQHRAVLMDAAAKARKRDIAATLAAGKKARQTLISKGVKFHAFPAAELKKWQRANPDFFKDLMESLSRQGKGEAARKMVALWRSMRQRIHCPEN